MRYFWCELAIVSAFMITFAVEFNSLTIINIRTMVNYKDLGLVNTRDMFAKAIKGGYENAFPAEWRPPSRQPFLSVAVQT